MNQKIANDANEGQYFDFVVDYSFEYANKWLFWSKKFEQTNSATSKTRKQ